MIPAIILAAGTGRRIGIPKLRLQFKSDFFVSIIYKKLTKSGFDNIYCVVRNSEADWLRSILPEIQIVINDETEKGMIYSVYKGIREIKNARGILIYPVDHPDVSSETLSSLILEFNKFPDCIIIPQFKNKSGHPIVIPKLMSDLISEKSISLNEEIKKSKLCIKYLQVRDSGILKNINEKKDLL